MKKKSVSKNNNIDGKEVIDRLYSKEYEKIKDRIQKEKEEKERKNRKKQIIDWDKVNYENNSKYSDNKKKDLIKIEEPKNINNNERNSIEEPFSSNSNNNDNLNTHNRNILSNITGKGNKGQLLLIDKIKSEHSINFKSPKNIRKVPGNFNINNMKNYIEIQSLSSDMNSIVNGNDSKIENSNKK